MCVFSVIEGEFVVVYPGCQRNAFSRLVRTLSDSKSTVERWFGIAERSLRP